MTFDAANAIQNVSELPEPPKYLRAVFAMAAVLLCLQNSTVNISGDGCLGGTYAGRTPGHVRLL